MLLSFTRNGVSENAVCQTLADILADFSFEVMPRTAAKVDSLSEMLPKETLVYLAHIDGTPLEDMVTTAGRLSREGFTVMPHFPARSFQSEAELRELIDRYQQVAGIRQALILAGGASKREGPFASARDLLETGAFADASFARLHFAGHPEGNRDIDPDGGRRNLDAAIRWKAEYSRETGVETALVTQFVFSAQPVLDWVGSLRKSGVNMPVHVGVAGPAKLQTLIRYAVACGVGPSVSVLRKRARDMTALVRPFEPTNLLMDFAGARDAGDPNVPDKVHVFPLGGIGAAAAYLGGVTGRNNANSV